MIIFDTHCHLQDDRSIAGISEVIARAKAAGVKYMLCCGTREADWKTVRDLSTFYPEIVPAFGLHPWFVRQRSENWLVNLENILKETPSSAVGEIGLDHQIDNRDNKDQAAVFIEQLKLARKLKRPVSLHCRKAWGMMMDILEKQCGAPEGGAVHSYSGPPDHVQRLEKLNLSISFSGSITYERNRRGRESLAAVSEKYILVETDAPDIPPDGVESETNEPANCALIIKKIAELKGTTPERLSEITYANACRMFRKNDVPPGC